MTERLNSKVQPDGETRRTFLDRIRKLVGVAVVGPVAGFLTGWSEETGELPPELAQYLKSSRTLNPEEQRTALCEILKVRYKIHYDNFIHEKGYEYMPHPEAHLINGIDLTKTELEVSGFTSNPSTVFFAIRNNNTPLGPDEPTIIPFQMVVDARTRALSEEARFRKALEKALEPFLVESPA